MKFTFFQVKLISSDMIFIKWIKYTNKYFNVNLFIKMNMNDTKSFHMLQLQIHFPVNFEIFSNSRDISWPTFQAVLLNKYGDLETANLHLRHKKETRCVLLPTTLSTV